GSFGAFMDQALDQESDPRTGFARMLDEAAVSYTAPDHPAGCLIITAAANYSPQTADVEQDLRARRVANVRSFEERLARAREGGALAEEADVRALAVYFAAVIQGMSQQARDGATTEELRRTAAYAMSAWPEPEAWGTPCRRAPGCGDPPAGRPPRTVVGVRGGGRSASGRRRFVLRPAQARRHMRVSLVEAQCPELGRQLAVERATCVGPEAGAGGGGREPAGPAVAGPGHPHRPTLLLQPGKHPARGRDAHSLPSGDPAHRQRRGGALHEQSERHQRPQAYVVTMCQHPVQSSLQQGVHGHHPLPQPRGEIGVRVGSALVVRLGHVDCPRFVGSEPRWGSAAPGMASG